MLITKWTWFHDDVIKWKHFPRYWPFVWGIHRSPVNSTHKGQWRGTLMFSLIYAWINAWVYNREAGDLIRHRAHYDVIAMHNVSLIVNDFEYVFVDETANFKISWNIALLQLLRNYLDGLILKSTAASKFHPIFFNIMLPQTDDLPTHPYDIRVVVISYGPLTNSSVWHTGFCYLIWTTY